MRALDTTPAAAKVQEEAYRKLGPAGRFRVAMELSDFAHSLAKAGIRLRNPNLTNEESQPNPGRKAIRRSATTVRVEDFVRPATALLR